MNENTYQSLLESSTMPVHIQRHCKAVAKKADILAVKLAAQGIFLDREKLRAAALIHDVCKEQSDHATAGANWATQHGYPEIGAIIACHHWLSKEQENIISEESVLYLADKLVRETQEVSLEERFSASLEKCKGNAALKAHELRYAQAKRVEQLIMEVIDAHFTENPQKEVTA